MAIELNHTIVPAHDKVASAKFFAHIFRLPFAQSAVGYFAPVRVNEALTLDFADSDEEFEAIFARIRQEGRVYGSGPYSRKDMQINHRGGGRGVYFCDPNGHVLELLTVG